jgi:iron complex transport system ATP-binding protein
MLQFANMMTTKPLLQFVDVSFTWPDPDQESYSEKTIRKPVFDAFTAEIPSGFISLTGANGTGKSTFMLLASGRILPDTGKIVLCGEDTRILNGLGPGGQGLSPEIEHKRNLVCSYLYQNMEFEEQSESNSRIGTLLEFVYAHGGHRSKDEQYLKDVIKAFELKHLEDRKLDALSKGEIQRVLLAFSSLYGSQVIMMDEPVFAMEQYQKEQALEFFKDLHQRTGVSVLVSLHELALTRKYADSVMLFYPDRQIDLGTCNEVLTADALEKAYGIPASMMHDTERLTRNSMIERDSV